MIKKIGQIQRKNTDASSAVNSIFAIGAADSQEIDQINILQASLLAMQRSLEKLDMQPKKVLVDGNHIFETWQSCF